MKWLHRKPRPEPAPPEIVYMPISETAAAARLDALRGLDENDRVLGAALALLAQLHARLLVLAESADADDAAGALREAMGVRRAISEIVAATRGQPPRPSLGTPRGPGHAQRNP